MAYNLPRIEISEDERLWMNELYSMLKKGEKPTYRALKARLYDKISRDFDPRKIDICLVYGAELMLHGIWQLDPETDLLEKADKVITLIKDKLLSDLSVTNITSEEVSKGLDMQERDVMLVLGLISHYGSFYAGANGPSDGYGFTSIGVDSDNVYDEYFKYDGIESLILRRYEYNHNIASRTDSLSQPLSDAQKHQNIVNPIFRSKITTIDPKLCFVLMPFSEMWSNRVYRELIKKNIEDLGLQCLRADNLRGQIVMEDIWVKINQCAFVIADVTGKNPNVMYELGIVHAIGKPSVLITQDISNIPFDFAHLRHYEYQDNIDGFRKLTDMFPEIVKATYNTHYENGTNYIDDLSFEIGYPIT